jgi:hypothetical protein
MTSRLELLRANTRDQVAATVARVRRLSAGPALVRLIAFVAAVVALVTALPLELVLAAPLSVAVRLGAAVVVVSLGVGLAPRSRFVSLIALATIVTWLASTIAFAEPITLPRVGLLTAALYVMHAAAAFAAVLPYDCVLGAGVLGPWLARVGSVLGVSLLVGLLGMAVAGQLPAVNSVVGPIVGSAVAAGLVGLLAWHLRGRRG